MMHETVWHDHPDDVPLVFSLTCKNHKKVHTYDYSGFGAEFLPIARAFAWAVIRRAHAVGHETRTTVGTAIRHFEKYIRTIPPEYRPLAPSHISESLLREYAKWLKDKSGLSYRSAAGSFRVVMPFISQWEGHSWAAADLGVPGFMFPRSNAQYTKQLSKGYTDKELKQIVKHVISDIETSNKRLKRTHQRKHVEQPPPLDDVAPETAHGNPIGAKWTVFEYRVWWWENTCKCQRLTGTEMRGKPGAHSFLYGYWQQGSSRRTIKTADSRLQAFYTTIGAGPDYVPKYLDKPPPIRYNSKWQKLEYLDWVWENECGCRALTMGQLRKINSQMYVALREHHGGYEVFCKRNEIKTTLVLDDLCPYYVALLLATALNPTVIQTLKIDCLTQAPLAPEKQSLVWEKLRSNKAGLTIPANGQAALAPSKIVNDLIEITAPYRGVNNLFLFATNGRRDAHHAMDHCTFGRSIKRWFKLHGLERTEFAKSAVSMHAATNFRPAIAKVGYERTGSIEFVRTLLSHSRVGTTVDYIGKLSESHLTFQRGVHIEAIFVGALSGRDAAREFVQNQLSQRTVPIVNQSNLTETMDAHCRDVLHSPIQGQVKGRTCSAQHACLYCANLVVTVDDIQRHFSMEHYYRKKVVSGEITAEACELLIGERVFMFEANILPNYDAALIAWLRSYAVRNPPLEYQEN